MEMAGSIRACHGSNVRAGPGQSTSKLPWAEPGRAEIF